MIDKGMTVQNNFYGGHSLGGAMITEYVAKLDEHSDTTGPILMGSFLTRKYY